MTKRSAQILYAENGSARNIRLMAMAFWVPLAFLAAVVTYAASRDLTALIFGAFTPVFFMIPLGLLYRNWPTGIRMDADGIRIGAVRRKHFLRRTPTVTHQAFRVCSVPWSAVRHWMVTTDRGTIEQFHNTDGAWTLNCRWDRPKDMGYCCVGVLTPPFMRACLMVQVDPRKATYPKLRPATFFENGIVFPIPMFIEKDQVRPAKSITWIVPTRHPARLAAKIAELHARGIGPEPLPADVEPWPTDPIDAELEQAREEARRNAAPEVQELKRKFDDLSRRAHEWEEQQEELRNRRRRR